MPVSRRRLVENANRFDKAKLSDRTFLDVRLKSAKLHCLGPARRRKITLRVNLLAVVQHDVIDFVGHVPDDLFNARVKSNLAAKTLKALDQLEKNVTHAVKWSCKAFEKD